MDINKNFFADVDKFAAVEKFSPNLKFSSNFKISRRSNFSQKSQLSLRNGKHVETFTLQTTLSSSTPAAWFMNMFSITFILQHSVPF